MCVRMCVCVCVSVYVCASGGGGVEEFESKSGGWVYVIVYVNRRGGGYRERGVGNVIYFSKCLNLSRILFTYWYTELLCFYNTAICDII